jgi:hypothetical protein
MRNEHKIIFIISTAITYSQKERKKRDILVKRLPRVFFPQFQRIECQL